MAIKKVQGGWFCSLTGHTYDSEEAARHYDEIYSRQLQADAARRDDPDVDRILTPGSGLTQKQTAEGVRKYIVSELAAINERENLVTSESEIDAFKARHPEYEDDGDKGVWNGQVMRANLRARGIVNPRYEDLRESFAQLKADNQLHLKPGVVRQQEQARVEARVSKQSPDFDEAEAYSIPLEELEMRARNTYIR